LQEHIADAADSADDPLGGRRWWLEAESPWQALAACHELTAALRSPDPAAYPCALPIQLDGSCNGLQHYAALGRDEDGGRAVNLVPLRKPGDGTPLTAAEDKPQDVYSKVLLLVIKRMEADAELPEPTAAALLSAGTRGAAVRDFSVADDEGDGSEGVWSALADATMGEQATAAAAAGESAPPPPAADARQLALRRMAARFLAGQVTRKVIKQVRSALLLLQLLLRPRLLCGIPCASPPPLLLQTVMTSVYGVTFIGARDQILARLKERFPEGHAGLNSEELADTLSACAGYLARTTLDSLGDLFSSADAIKKWLAEVARLVAMAAQPVAWIPPPGLPVVQVRAMGGGGGGGGGRSGRGLFIKR